MHGEGFTRPRGWLRVGLIGLLAAVEPASPARGAPAAKDVVAVLELESRSRRLTVEDVQYVTDAVRKAASDALDPSRHIVMTRENMDIIVPPEERKCLSGMCYAEIGKRLQAQVVIGGNVRDFGDQFGVTLEAYESRTGAVLGVEQGEAKSQAAVLALVREMAPRLLKRVIGGIGVPPPPPPGAGAAVSSQGDRLGVIRPELGFLRVEGSPKGARVEIAGPREFGDGGRLATALPYGPAEVPAGEYRVEVSSPGYDSESRTVFVPADRTATADVTLVRSEGTLEVTGTPEGARVEVACAKGFSRVFGLPGVLAVPRGSCVVKVNRTGYVPFERTVMVEGGKVEKVEARLAESASPSGSGLAGKAVDWVRIPGGRFLMGSKKGDGDEKPVHEVVVGTFEMWPTEVTVGQYRACVEAGACTAPGTGYQCNWGVSGREDHPVNCVDWNQAAAYSRWVGGRLPTESEWEYAARSGGKGREYPWGDEKATCARAVMDDGGSGCGRGGTWPVCSKEGGNTEQGLCDMSGNVWEWVQDWYHDSYAGAPGDGRAWESPAGSSRAFRGGSWGNGAGYVRAANRGWGAPGARSDYLGFRPARSVR